VARVGREIGLRGVVQGVGMRPWLARRARELALHGEVRNAPWGVRVLVEGEAAAVERLLALLREAPPAAARIEHVDVAEAAPRGAAGFRVASTASEPGPAPTRVPPDRPVCDACLDDLFDERGRRYRHPFTHCALCGPRASVLLDLPYDRERTTLARFPLCEACRREYEDPEDRRFHAQTLACPACGPQLAARAPDGASLAGDPVERAAAVLASGGIVALKGYGGYHLAVDATRSEAVERLRKRKQRPARPFAVMVPDADGARRLARLDEAGLAWLAGEVRAVVVAPRRPQACRALGLAEAVAPRARDLGLLLPVAPLHWLLLWEPGSRPGRGRPRFPALVLTSANRSGEPTLHDDDEARERLRDVADLLVVHDRDVARPHDDPVVRTGPGGPVVLRRSRATAPRALALPAPLRAAVDGIAVGGDWKNAAAVLARGEVILAEHGGDLASPEAVDALEARVEGLVALVRARPAFVAHDLHPEYASTETAARLARAWGLPTVAVAHHHAHAAAVLAEHGRVGPALGVVLDGSGYGADGGLWGGEILCASLSGFERLGHLEPAPLPGGDAAAREPWRMALAWLGRAFPEGAPRLPWHERRDERALALLERAMARGLASPESSSCGRLFDAVASLLDVADHNRFEGEAAMALESLASEADPAAPLVRAAREPGPFVPCGGAIPVADGIRRLVEARRRGADRAELARAFHVGLAARLASAGVAAARRAELREVVLAGGCLANRLLLAELEEAFGRAGLAVLRPRILPPGDGALSVGQAAVAAALGPGAGGLRPGSARGASPRRR